MIRLLSPDQMREAEKQVNECYGLPYEIMMERAALGVSEKVLALGCDTVTVLCGAGNNGADGAACARQLLSHGITVTVIYVQPVAKLQKLAKTQYETLCRWPGARVVEALTMEALDAVWPTQGAIVDALLGTGFHPPLDGWFAQVIQRANTSLPIVAVDIPSGVDGADGYCDGAIRAEHTVTFGFAKPGHWLYPGREFCGELTVCDIGLPPVEYAPINEYVEMLRQSDCEIILPSRKANTHKGHYGHGLMVAGSSGMLGAGVLASRAVLKAGAGLCTWAVPDEMRDLAMLRSTEVMVAATGEGLEPLLAGKSAVALGCGMARHERLPQLLREAVMQPLPLVLDADGLNMLDTRTLAQRTIPAVLTPHPLEMSRLTGLTVAEIVRNPLEIARRWAREWNAVVLLKGASTVIAAEDGRVSVNGNGNAGMATGGSGDVLTGVILGLLCQGLQPYDAARLGAWLHGNAGDRAAKQGERSITAKDILNNM